MTRGGFREGAGRPREAIQTAVRLPIADVAVADAVVARLREQGVIVTRSDVLRRWIAEGADREGSEGR